MDLSAPIALLGLGVENRGLAGWLAAHGHRFTVCDTNPAARDATARDDSLPWATAVDDWRLGAGAFADLQRFATLFRSPGIWARRPELRAARAEGRLSSGIDLFLQRCPAPITGITGTKGKGTTASWLAAILRVAGRTVHLGGNIGTPPVTFLDQVQPDDAVILELSSFQLQDLGRSPAGAVVLPVATDHLDVHATREEYVEAKGEICRHQGVGDWVVAAADETAGQLAVASPGRRLQAGGTREPAADGCWVRGERILWRSGGCEVDVADVADLRLPGPHNRDNACAAVAAALTLGADPGCIPEGLRAFEGLPHRLERVAERHGVLYVNDSLATTPEAAAAGLRACAGRPVCLIAGGSSKGADFAQLGRVIAGAAAALVTLGQEGGTIAAAARAAGFAGPIDADRLSMAAAVEAAAGRVPAGGVVLLSPGCASFGMFASYAERGEAFRQAVAAL